MTTADTTYEELFHAQFATMTRLAALLGADDPEDIAQDAFVRVHARWSSLLETTAAKAYLRMVVTNLTRNNHRHRKVAARHLPAVRFDIPSSEDSVLLRADDTPLVVALRKLPHRQREALVLRYWLQLSEAEIAQTMKVTVGSVKTHTSRGMTTLRAEMSSQEMDLR